ncbi:MAG: Stk1 family PASTA domain-containing Ser/Thr kinase [Candidatus Meridianibacter frigidus]|nr:MAG: Stk1 family PASTA domain-containing Ser/Thr kinase [Candidatus Eremiobacteraeota bacterium]
MISQTFNNRYRLDERLGEGGMAMVYCGTDTLLRRRVAVKVLRAQYAADDEFVRRFYQEAESAARLQHPNIVNTYDVGREGDTYYIVMELVEGPSLAEMIAADGRIPEPVAIDYATQICNGLAFAHRQGLLHRDIKPANILVTKDDVVKLSDFGIARAVSQQTMAMTKPGMVMGSVYYLSPEQAQGHELHETSDLYSLGIVVFQMLTGKLPYSGESPVTVALKHISDPVPTIPTAELGVSPALAAIVNKLLQKNPAGRFHSASDVATALREARERPSHAAFTLSNDAPTTSYAIFEKPPPRPSRFPDYALPYTSVSDDEARGERSRTGLLVALVALLVIAAVAGYFFVGRGGLQKIIAPSVKVGNYVTMGDAQAQQRIVNAGLSARISLTASETISANHVISQHPAAGSSIPKSSVVELLVSSGLPTIGLRDVRGFSAQDATRLLEEDKFISQTVLKFSKAAKDSVIDQDPQPGTHVREGSKVTLIVSQGPAPIAVPNLISQDFTKAAALLAKLNLKLHVANKVASDTVATGKITEQDILPQTNVDAGTVVNVVVSLGPAASSVPSISTLNYKDAVSTLTQAGFKVAVQYSVQQDANGMIIQQTPDPGTQLPRGSTVTVLLSVPGAVPDTQGMTSNDAKATLEAAGYTVGNIAFTKEGADGKVVRTEPEAGTVKRPGEAVTVYVNGDSKSP